VSSDGNTTAVDCAAALAPNARTISSAAQLTQTRHRMALVIYWEAVEVSSMKVGHDELPRRNGTVGTHAPAVCETGRRATPWLPAWIVCCIG
jgi:hypothetical protein